MRRVAQALAVVFVLGLIVLVAASSLFTSDFSGFISRVGTVFTTGDSQDAPQLKPAQVAWNTPEQMRVGETVPIELRATFDTALGQTVASRITASGPVRQESTELSQVLSATLSGPSGVEILPKEAVRQQIRTREEAVWMWTLEAKRAGDFPIILTLTSVENGQPVGAPFRRTIKVSAVPFSDAQSFVRKNWKDIYAVVLVPIAGGIFAWWKRRRGKTEKLPRRLRSRGG